MNPIQEAREVYAEIYSDDLQDAEQASAAFGRFDAAIRKIQADAFALGWMTHSERFGKNPVTNGLPPSAAANPYRSTDSEEQ